LVSTLGQRRETERMERAKIAAFQAQRLGDLIAAMKTNPFYRAKLDGHSFADMGDLTQLPFTTKSELCADQTTHPPYGTNLTYSLEDYTRMHQTSGTTAQPMRWLDTAESWQWILDCWQLIYDAAGIESTDRVFFPFSFGPFIGFWGAFEGAQARGCFSLAGGGLSTKARLEMLDLHRITCVCCTPTYALRMAQVADEMSMNLASTAVRALILAGEPGASIPATRKRIEAAWGAEVFDHSGMTEIGSMSMECREVAGGPHVLETEFIAEVIEVDGTQPVPDGKTGELVITNLGRVGSPLIRYRTGDLVVKSDRACQCGRKTARLLGGILGRIDEMIFIKGNNLYPSQIESIIREHEDVLEFRIVIDDQKGLSQLTLELEPKPHALDRAHHIADAIADNIRNRFHFHARTRIAGLGKLPRFEMKARRVVDRRRTAT